MKIESWKGNDLEGPWLVTYKIDGVRAFLRPTGAFSRKDKPLYNLTSYLPSKGERDVEVFLGTFKESIQGTRTQSTMLILPEHLYDLNPIDARLTGPKLTDPTAEYIWAHMEEAIEKGYEGLVLRQDDTWLKIKPISTYDVEVLDIIPGKGKHLGRMGALLTSMGKVGTGFDDPERMKWWNNKEQLIGTVIEVSCMSITEDGKFRHPRFIRERPDKT